MQACNMQLQVLADSWQDVFDHELVFVLCLIMVWHSCRSLTP